VLIPVYNEKDTILQILERVKRQPFPKEIIIVDDGSTDGTRELLSKIEDEEVRIFYQKKNKGKGACIRWAISEAKGDIIIIQDADLEYHPEEYPIILRPILEGRADVVYGSRFLGVHRVFMFWHYIGNKFLTFLTNFLYNTMLTDMEVGYKAFRADVIKKIPLRSNRFDIEPEITAKIFKRRLRVFEVPITYDGRGYEEGKKITWRDGFVAIYTLLKYRFMD
jgi:glycosyltransferase involved in cell wall biosynthesis